MKWGESGGPWCGRASASRSASAPTMAARAGPRSARRGAAASEDVDATVEAVGGGDRGTGGDW